MTEAKTPVGSKTIPRPSLAMHQQILNLRVRDMMGQLNTVMKTMTDENAALKKENADLKAKKQTS